MFAFLGTAASFIFGNAKMLLMIAVAIVLAAAAFYWNYSQNKIQTLTQENAQLTLSLELQQETIKTLQETIQKSNKELKFLRDAFNAIDARAAEVNKFFSENDIGKMARENPEGLRATLNNMLNQLFKDLEAITQPSTFEVRYAE